MTGNRVEHPLRFTHLPGVRVLILIWLLLFGVYPVYLGITPAMAAEAGDVSDWNGLTVKAEENKPAVMALVTTELYVRAEPSAGSTALAIAHQGDQIPILEKTDGSWVKTRVLKDGQPVEGYVNGSYLQYPEGAAEDKVAKEVATETATEAATEAAAGAETEETSSEETPTEVSSEEGPKAGEAAVEVDFTGAPGQYLWIGDSRTEAMALYVKQDVYCAAESADLKWLKGEGKELVSKALDTFTGDMVILSLGINDLQHARGYIMAFRRLIHRYPDKTFWILSVGPVNEATEAANGYVVQNSEIEEMNAVFGEAFPGRYLDIYSRLRETGFDSNDGVHYTPDSCRKLSDFIHLALPLQQLGNQWLSFWVPGEG